MNKKRIIIAFFALFLLLVLAGFAGVVLGSIKIGTGEVLQILAGNGADLTHENIIINIRLPRALAAIILGGALALSGYLLQTFFANPIVGPFVLGISSGAKLTVAICMIFLLRAGRNISAAGMVFAAFLGAMAAMGFVLLLSVKVKSMSLLVVCGIMVGYICSAVTDLLVTFADDSSIVNLHNWSMGSLSGINMRDVGIMTVVIMACLLCCLLLSKPIGAYRLGEGYAKNMGVNITLLRVFLILLSSLLAACVTAFAGPISFVGIATPHLVKNIMKTTKPQIMIPGVFLGGAVITLFCDAIARTVFAPTEVSISSVTAVLLVPVVIFMMVQRKREMH